jgi:hypothetical protein
VSAMAAASDNDTLEGVEFPATLVDALLGEAPEARSEVPEARSPLESDGLGFLWSQRMSFEPYVLGSYGPYGS